MLCKDIMRRPVQWVGRGESVQAAAQKMRDFRVGFLPVCGDGDRVVGVVTDRDMAVRVCATGESPEKTPVEAIMSTDLVTCSPNAEIEDAEALMAANRKSRVLVLDSGGSPAGVISLSDIAGRPGPEGSDTLRRVASREVLGEASRPRR